MPAPQGQVKKLSPWKALGVTGFLFTLRRWLARKVAAASRLYWLEAAAARATGIFESVSHPIQSAGKPYPPSSPPLVIDAGDQLPAAGSITKLEILIVARFSGS